MRRLLALALAASIGTGGSRLQAEVPSTPRQDPPSVGEEALAMVHDGRFAAATEILGRTDSAPRDASIDFLLTFVTYWRLIYDEDNEALQDAFEREISGLLRRIEQRPDRGRVAGQDLVWAGTGHLLLAQLRAMQKKPFAGAFEAKKAKRHLDAADLEGTGVDSLFGLGAYNYMADRVSGFVKGLRALLALPGGNRELGLRQLERAAAESRYFALEARLLLVTIYANKHERRYDDALAEIAKAKTLAPERLTTLHAEARFLLGLGRFDVVADIVERALARAAALTDVDPTVVTTFQSMGARAELGRLRADRARRQAAAALETPGLPIDLRPGLGAIVEQSAAIEAGSSWPQAFAALEAEARGDAEGAANEARRASAAAPADPLLALVAGRAMLRTGDAAGALPLLARADASPRLPPAWKGLCKLLAGRAADAAGERERALRYYRAAAGISGYAGRDAAHLCQTRTCGAAE